jgi:RING finger protein 113A
VDGTKDWARDMNVYKSSGEKTNVPSAQDLATWENTLHLTDEERIQKSKNEEKILSGEDAEHAEKIYRGLNNYTKYVDNSQQHTVKGAGIQQGPQRISSHIRWSARFDYQPDVCKDYKETGYCGYGDSCKFLHDRGDYKTGWELEKEWEDQQRLKRMGTKRQEENYEIQQEEDVPFACFICRKPFVDPVVTKCHHYFCEKCALSTFKKDMKCQICGTNTFGSFSIVDKKTKEKLQKRYQMALEKGEIAPDNDESNTAQQDDPPQNRSDDP